MPKRKSQQRDRGWGSLPWKSIQVQEGQLGEATDAFAFTIEEVDGSLYAMEKDALGGYRVQAKGGGGGITTTTTKGKDQQQHQKKKKQKKGGAAKTGEEEEEDVQEPDEEDVMEIEYENAAPTAAAASAAADEEEEEEEDGGDDDEAAATTTTTTTTTTKKTKQEKRKEKQQARKKEKRQQKQQQKQANKATTTTTTTTTTTKSTPPPPPTVDLATIKAQLTQWMPKVLNGATLHPLLLQNLHRQGFVAPTPIQRQALPLAMCNGGKDIMGAAETGSGKTLAYGLPILDFLLKRREKTESSTTDTHTHTQTDTKYGALAALILCPTRELALQVTAHLQEMLQHDPVPGRERINIQSIVGGLSETKQERLLKRRPEVVVATIGRLWELVKGGVGPHLREMGRLRFLVLDEADRMVEEGHYPELNELVTRVVEQGKAYQRDYDETRRKEKEARLRKKGKGKAKKGGMKEEQGKKEVEEEEEEGEFEEGEEEGEEGEDNGGDDEEEGEEEEEEEEEEDEDAGTEELAPAEVKTKTLAEIMREAKRLGIKGLHGLEEMEEGGEENEGEEGDEEEEDDSSVEIGSGGGGSDEEEEEEEEEEGEEEEEVEMELQDVQGDTEAELGFDDEVTTSLRALPPPVKRQTLIFSATLVMPEEMRGSKKDKKNKTLGQSKDKKGADVMARIMRDVGIRGKPAIVNLSRNDNNKTDDGADDAQLPTTPQAAAALGQKGKGGAPLTLPSGLELCHIKSVGGHKDAHLYYFLRRYPGRTIIFTNSIDQTRRLAQLLSLLRLPARALHAKMQQRARLKSLDQFRGQSDAILVATDVAARGLDIPLVEHVIHYDLPRSLEVFVHRAGRTARANRQGLSFSLVAPRDERMHGEICRALLVSAGGGEEEDGGEGGGGGTPSMATFPVDLQELNAVRERVHLAGKIVGYEQETGRQHASQSWFLKKAKDADLELDDELLEETQQGTQQDRQRALQQARDRQRLAELLAQPLLQQRRKFVNVAAKLQQLEEIQGVEARQVLHREKREKKGGGKKYRRKK